MINHLFRAGFSGIYLTVLILLTACHRPTTENAASVPPDVGVSTMLKQKLRATNEFNGRVEAIQSVDIRPRVSGYIDRIAYVEGADVKAGALLFVIDPRPYRDALNAAQAQLDSARAAEKLAQSRFGRASQLVDSHYISKQDFDTSKSSLDQTAADVHAAKAAVATASLNLGFTQVRAPVAGRAGRALLTLGNLARADESLLTTVVSQEKMYVYFDCDEHSYLRYSSGSGDEASARVALMDEEGFPRTAQVDFMDNRLDPSTGTIRARAIVPNSDRKLTPGLFARVHFESGVPVDTRLIDDKAILTDQDRRYVYLVDAEGRAVRKDINVGRLIAGMRVVVSGLGDSDKVIVTGAQKVLFPGMPVHAVSASSEESLTTSEPVAANLER